MGRASAVAGRTLARCGRGLAGCIAAGTIVMACGQSHSAAGSGTAAEADSVSASAGLGTESDSEDVPPYAGHGPHGIPLYARRAFTADERLLLRTKYGIADPTRLYVSDSTEDGLLKYDTKPKTCATCYVNSYRVGFTSVRRPGETWEAVERRVRATPLRRFPASARATSTSTADLDPAVRDDAEQMLADARRLGFHLRVTATYRSPLREAYLMAEGRGRTHTLTSMHSYGRALDILVDDGNLRHQSTRASWVAFRRWVSRYRGGEFHIIGTPDRTWDWPHVEVPTPDLGFRTIDDALARARLCDPTGSGIPCNFPPHLPR